MRRMDHTARRSPEIRSLKRGSRSVRARFKEHLTKVLFGEPITQIPDRDIPAELPAM
jgi:hypothetical protein